MRERNANREMEMNEITKILPKELEKVEDEKIIVRKEDRKECRPHNKRGINKDERRRNAR